MAMTEDKKTIIVMDDEPYELEWLFDFLEAKGYIAISATNATDAINMLAGPVCRALVLDLNVPIALETVGSAINVGDVYRKYPGLFVAKEARNRGYRDRQVIIYSVHRDAEVALEAKKIGCEYILKGRPAELKREILSVLSYDPTDQK